MASFVLIPGAGGMAWYWHRLVPLIRAAGHEPLAIDLPGDDRHAGLAAYADTVARAIGERSDVILVAQSLAGFTAPLACARATVRMIVFVNAMIPKPGETAGAWWGWIVESALKNKQFVIDGEAVGLGVDGISDFNALHSGKHNDEVQLHAFDILALNGNDLRHLPLSMRKAHLSRLLARRPDGIFLSDFGQGEIGPDLFRAACNMGLEGLFSKRLDRPYRGGRSKDWIKVKNRTHPQLSAWRESFF